MKNSTMLFANNLNTTKGTQLFFLRHHVTQYKVMKTCTDHMCRLTLKEPMQTTFKGLKKKRFSIFSFSKNIDDSIR